MTDFMDTFNKWLESKDFYIEIEFPYGHKKTCKFIKATSEPKMGVYSSGCCDTCSYESPCIEFEGECSCGKVVSFQIQGSFELGTMMREMIELSNES